MTLFLAFWPCPCARLTVMGRPPRVRGMACATLEVGAAAANAAEEKEAEAEAEMARAEED